MELMEYDRDYYFEKYGEALEGYGLTLYVNCNADGTEVYSLTVRNSEGEVVKGITEEEPLQQVLELLENRPKHH